MTTIRIWLLAAVLALSAAGRVDALPLGCCVCDCPSGTTCTDGQVITCSSDCESAGCTERSAVPALCSSVPFCPEVQAARAAPALSPLGLAFGLAAAVASGGIALRRRRRA